MWTESGLRRAIPVALTTRLGPYQRVAAFNGEPRDVLRPPQIAACIDCIETAARKIHAAPGSRFIGAQTAQARTPRRWGPEEPRESPAGVRG